MTDIDLDELDRLHAEEAPWLWHRDQIVDRDVAIAMTIRNAYPALAAEIRKLRAKVEAIEASRDRMLHLLRDAIVLIETAGGKMFGQPVQSPSWEERRNKFRDDVTRAAKEASDE